MLYLILVIGLIAVGVLLIIFKKTAFVQKLLSAFKKGTGQKVGYDLIEPVMPGQTKVLPKAYLTPKGATVHKDTAPIQLELTKIDEAIDEAIRRGFRPNPDFNPPDALSKGAMFKKHSDYRFLLVDTTYETQENEPLGAPILYTYSGYCSGITTGFPLVNQRIKAVFPLIILPKMTKTEDKYVEFWKTSAYNECEHCVTANDTNVYMTYHAYDAHPIFPE